MGEGIVKRTVMLDQGGICFVEILVKFGDPDLVRAQQEQRTSMYGKEEEM